MNNEAIKKTLDSGSGKALKEYLAQKMLELLDITLIKECEDPVAQAIEIKSSKRAYEKLREVFSEVMSFPDDRPKDPRDSFHVE